jgi:DNA-binding NtrC family response regulator
MSLLRPDTANVRPLHRQRVLVATTDRRFLRVAGFLLAREGYDVDSSRRPSELLDDIDRQLPNVVVLDGSDSLAAAVRTVAAIEALHPRVRVLIVVEDDARPVSKMLRVFPKWSAMNDLLREVERPYPGVAG